MKKTIAKVIGTFDTSLYKIFIDQSVFVYVNNAHTPTIAYICDMVVPKNKNYIFSLFSLL